MRTLWLVLAAVLAVGSFAWGQTPTPGGSLTIAINAEPPVLDPTASTSQEIARILYDNVLQGLVKFNAKGEIVPALAEKWTISPGGLTYTFELRRNVVFHDGSAFDAEDVVFKFTRARNPQSGHTHPEYYRDITRIETPTSHTVVFRMRQPNSEFLINLARPDSVIGPSGRLDEQRTAPVGTGPFRFVQWERGVGIRLERHARYYVQGRPYLERVTFRFLPDQNAQLAALRAGDIDVMGYGVIPENALAVQRDPALRLITGTSTTEITVGMNNSRPPFNDLRVRRAMQHAINKDEIVRGVMMGFGTKIGSHRSPGESCYVDLSGHYAPDAARARALLSEAGYGPASPLAFTFTLAAPYPYERRIGEAISAQLARVGVQARLEVVEWATWLSRVFRGADYQMTIIGHSEPNDIEIYANPNYYFRYDNPRFAQLLADYQRLNHPERACNLMKDLQRLLADDAVNVWVMNAPYIAAMRRAVNGWWTDQPTPSMNVTEVFLAR
ncbi:MAG: ABC transporter substrate-binding protein [Armatimonadota bacterium]|nr:ABC transporter substrate-binding protein [Armatimonadota bacterium]MDR7423429.1 ABC transporter substrate-binding protein [Armatimonadota bacterium]MDR7454738.1 ABC transporter substrate-binding protein [Armatimonadota bacterium]MDR7498049.1 ABC transporter substrate-binding protein [Armatimonadota bacterium]MDR7513087.1 ABC transporter substrate-binding protein [Armatimonadota bacterium]